MITVCFFIFLAEAEGEQAIAKAVGKNPEIQDSISKMNAILEKKGLTPRYVYDEKSDFMNGSIRNGVVTYNLASKESLVNTTVHELVHHWADTDPETYKGYRALVHELIIKDPKYQKLYSDTVDTYRANVKDITDDELGREAEAAITKDMLFDEKKLQDLVLKDRTIGQKLLDLIKRAINSFAININDSNAARFREAKRVLEGALGNKESIKENATLVGGARYSISNDLKDQLDKWISGQMEHEDYFTLGNTPESLSRNGAQNLPLIMSQDVIVKATGGKHNIALDEIAKLPDQISRPTMLFKGSQPDSFVVLTEMRDKSGNEVIAAIHLNKYQKRMLVNRIASFYGKENAENYVLDNISKGNLIDADKIKSPAWFANRGLQLPKLVQTIAGSDTTIPQSGEGVNNSISGEAENDTAYSLDNKKPFAQNLEEQRAAQAEKVPSGETKTRKFAQSVLESKVAKNGEIRSALDRELMEGAYNYQVMPNISAIRTAKRIMEDMPNAKKTWAAVVDGDKVPSASDVALGEQLLVEAAAMNDAGQVSEENVNQVRELVAELAFVGTRTAQSLQAYSLIDKLSPVGKIYYLQKFINNTNNAISKSKEFRNKPPLIRMDDVLVKKLLEARTLTEIEIAEANIIEQITGQIPASIAEKVNSWRYLAMLGNPKTH